MVTPIERANMLVETLPYIKEFYGKTIVIKYGGHAMINEDLKKAVMMDLVLMKFVGMHPVVVHGGGPEITALLNKLGKESQFINGLRVTDAETMEIVEMVLVGKVNKSIVSGINHHGGKAVGLSGKDGNLIEAKPQKVTSVNGNGEKVSHDLGYVGEVERVNPGLVETLIHEGYIPVIAPTGTGQDGESYNINADYVAGALAQALKAYKLVLLTDVEGIKGSRGELISSLDVEQVPKLIETGIISGGMIPKVECCVKALTGGVSRTHIIDGRIPHSTLLELFTDEGIGTMVVKSGKVELG